MTTRSHNLVIAVDGPAASGKGTIARALARHYGLPHMDTGALYRAVGLAALLRGGDPHDPDDAEAAARALDLTLLENARLREAGTSEAASAVAVHPGVRAALFELQRAFAHQLGGAVLDGRDIGTVIAPDADAKLFVTASAEIRAERRRAELAARGQPCDFDTVLGDIRTRDARDAGRDAAPLARADDALLLDTSDFGIDAAVQRAIALVEDRIGAMRERG